MSELHLEVPRGERRGLGRLRDVRWNVTVSITVGAVGVSIGMVAVGAVGVAIGAISVPVSVGITVPIRIPVSTEVLPTVGRSIAHAALFDRDIHLRLPRLVVLRPDGGHEIDEEAEDVEEVDECDDPLQHGCGVVLLLVLRHAECDGQAELHQDEEQLDPEAVAEHGRLAEVHAQPLVLPADEDGGYNVAGDEEHEEAVVEVRVAEGVEDGEEDEACGAGDGSDDCADAVNLLPDRGVGCEFARVS